MPEVTIVLDSDRVAIRCYPKNSHLILKIGTLSLILAASLLPKVHAELTRCLSKSAATKKGKQ
jgi:hypothetical protein